MDINWNYDDEGYNIDKLMINGPGGLEYSIYHQEKNKTIKSTLMFSSVGRGKYLLGKSHHDINLYKNVIDNNSPVTGFFSNGEISPIGDRTFLHGYTSSFAIFKEKK